ncbi:class I SAM-dependent methyltransferase [bacterium]|nr:class I SAM-dependent methyltransferase [bacterium]
MKKYFDVLQSPYTGKSLFFVVKDGIEGFEDKDGSFFPIENGYINFLKGRTITDLNKKYQGFYDKVGKIAGIFEKISSLFYDFKKIRGEQLENVCVKSGDKVLEVSIGTGWNISLFTKKAHYFGIDISSGMLKRCVKNKKRFGLNLDLFLGEAEFLPFKNESFDVVFHVGGINFFNDRAKAIEEMIRVAKSGTKIVIIDETEKFVEGWYQKLPFIKKYFKSEDIDKSRTKPPVEFVPKNTKDVKVEIIDDGQMYRLSFIKA